jgi:hypothetical protein
MITPFCFSFLHMKSYHTSIHYHSMIISIKHSNEMEQFFAISVGQKEEHQLCISHGV